MRQKWIEIQYKLPDEVNGTTYKLINCSKICDITLCKKEIIIYSQKSCLYCIRYKSISKALNGYDDINDFLIDENILIHTVESD